MFCSTIIPSVGRRTLSRAIESVLNQEFSHGDFEIILVNDTGETLSDSRLPRSNKLKVINTHRRERSVARNTGASIAKGRYLHFLDDDDWLAPSALRHFWELSHSSSAKWLYGISQLVDRQDKPIIQLKHGLNGNCFVQVMAGEWIPLQSSLIETETFFTVGGFNQRITGPEDIDLLRRISLIADITETPHVVSHIAMGAAGSTTDYDRHPQESRWARELVLESSHAMERLVSSANSNYWKGRIVRLYLTSIIWNLLHKRLLIAGSRTGSSIASTVSAGRSLLTGDFWRAVARPYQSIAFARGLRRTGV
jgi:glycosyltransferase involved in cell wall biosynthesis